MKYYIHIVNICGKYHLQVRVCVCVCVCVGGGGGGMHMENVSLYIYIYKPQHFVKRNIQDLTLGPLLLTWIHFNHSMDK